MKKIISILIVALVALAFMGCPTAFDDLEYTLGDWYYIDVTIGPDFPTGTGFLFVNNTGTPQTGNCPDTIVAKLEKGKAIYLGVDSKNTIIEVDTKPTDVSELPEISEDSARIYCITKGMDVLWSWGAITPKGTEVKNFPWGSAPTNGLTIIN